MGVLPPADPHACWRSVFPCVNPPRIGGRSVSPAGHFLLGPHWAVGTKGDGRFEGSLRPVLIDHAASFR